MASTRPSVRGMGAELFTAGESIPDEVEVLINADEAMVGHVRKVVRQEGAKVVFVRLSPEEKLELSRIIMHYKELGQKTTENEIGRIAMALLLEDWHQHREESFLARILEALRR